MNKSFLIILSFLLVSCSIIPRTEIATSNPFRNIVATSSIGDGGLFTLKPCAPPCFFGIYPEMSIDQLSLALETGLVFSTCENYMNSEIVDYQFWRCDRISIVSDLVNVQTISFFPEEKPSIGDIVNRYGDPDSVLLFPEILPDELPSIRMDLFFNNLKMIIHFSEQEGHVFKLTRNSIILGITYCSSKNYSLTREMALSSWKGFVDYPLLDQK